MKDLKIKVGDLVLLKNERGKDWCSNGDMDKYMGKVVTVRGFVPFSCNSFYIEEDEGDENAKHTMTGRWIFDIDDIEKIVTNQVVRLSDLHFADILTVRKGERYVVGDNALLGEEDTYYLDCDIISDSFDEDLTYYDHSWSGVSDRNTNYDIMKVERAGQVVYERKEEPVKEMTLAEVCKELGYEVKIVKENK